MSWREEDRGYETPCHIWTGKTDDRGYAMHLGFRVHRYVFEDETGQELPPDVHVHHKCEVKPCVRFDHLEALKVGDHMRHHRHVESERGLPSGAWRARAAAQFGGT